MAFRHYFGSPRVFRLVAAICVLFFLLTATAMVLYPGGTATDSTSQGYSFFRNFFSDLGMTRTPSGSPNYISQTLLTFALTTVGVGLAIFFLALVRFFVGSRSGRWLSGLASLFGIITGICFIGVAFTPWNLYLQAHNQFVHWAFRAFLAAVLLDAIAVFGEKSLPKQMAWVFIAFAVLLGAYILLLTIGPSPLTPEGLVVQATGQKIIAYASIVTILIQALTAHRISLDDRRSLGQGGSRA